MSSRTIQAAVLVLAAGAALAVGLGCSGSQETTRPTGRDRSGARPGATAAAEPAGQADWPAVFIRDFASGLDFVTAVTHAGDGSGRLFVTERAGRVRIVRGGVVAAQPFLDIEGRVRSGGEQGLLWTEFPPGYAQDRRFYVNYTRRPDGATVVARFRASSDPDNADEASEEVLLVVPQPFANHNGGQMAFGPDGYLYVGLGDGGSGGDPMNNAQNLGTLLGKILRIDVEAGGAAYAIPPGNPFAGQAGRRAEIWAFGLRNPWRFSFDRETGDLYIADVGQNAREEVDVQAAASAGGENYGWRYYEGTMVFSPGDSPPASHVPPVVEYDHSMGCSITGGYVYRGEDYPQLQGIYFYGDYCSGTIWGLRRAAGAWDSRALLESGLAITTFGEDEAGNVYVADGEDGTIFRLVSERAKFGSVRK